jgi:hypothetical protein
MSPDDELQRYVADLPRKLRDELAGVIEDEAEALSAAQRERLRSLQQAPDETGNLEQSCHVAEGAHDLEKFVQAGGDLTTTEIRGGSGEPYDYALGFEYGTSKQPARSFFWSTIRERLEAMQARISAAAERILG